MTDGDEWALGDEDCRVPKSWAPTLCDERQKEHQKGNDHQQESELLVDFSDSLHELMIAQWKARKWDSLYDEFLGTFLDNGPCPLS